MHDYQQVLVRMRAGDSVRQIAEQQLLGHQKAGEFRALAARQGWLEPSDPMPGDGAIAQALAAQARPHRPASTISSPRVEPWREQVRARMQAGDPGVAILRPSGACTAALQQERRTVLISAAVTGQIDARGAAA